MAFRDEDTTMKRLMTVISMMLMVTAGAWAAGGTAMAQDAKLKGMITAHDGSTIVVRGPAGDTTVTLTDTTEIRGTSGVLGVRGEDHPASDLIPGLAVEVTTVPGDTGVTASEVTFKNSDLKTAQQIAAGLVGTEARVAENSARIDKAGELVPAGQTRVFFKSGSTTLTAESKAKLDAIATDAKAITGAYRLAVVGRADPTGNAEANQRLSARRAAAVKAYLIETAGITPEKFIPTTALGEASVANDPDPPKSDAEARRVTVTIGVSAAARK